MATSNLQVIDKQKRQQCATALQIKVLKRILVVLRENGRSNRTNLAGKSGLNYGNCIKYLNLIHTLGWVDVIYNNGCYVVITERGIDIIERLGG